MADNELPTPGRLRARALTKRIAAEMLAGRAKRYHWAATAAADDRHAAAWALLSEASASQAKSAAAAAAAYEAAAGLLEESDVEGK